MIRWIFAAAASVALVATGLVHGFWTDRWSASADTAEAAARLDRVPRNIAGWEGEDLEVKTGQAGSGVTGCLQRRYLHRATGASVVIALVNGRPGPVATHTPEVCYGASGYLVDAKKPVRLDTEGRSAQFWSSRATKANVTDQTRVRIYWAWNAGDGWVASADARAEFPRFRHPILHKLYVVRDLNGEANPNPEGKKTGEGDRDEVCEAFLKVFMPELDRTLFHNPEG